MVGQLRWVSTFPSGKEVWIGQRRMELDRPQKRKSSGPVRWSAYYGGRYVDPSAPKGD